MGKVATAFIIAIACVTSGCAEKAAPEQVRQLQWLDKADPIEDAKKALVAGDAHLLAVNGYTEIIPGVEQSKTLEYKSRYGVQAIKGTSDAFVSSEHNRLNNVASEYARKYNEYVVANANKAL